MNRALSERKYVIAAVIVLLTIIFLIKLFSIQILDTKLKISAENNSQRHVIQYPARGLIYDRKGKLLVYNQAAYDLMLVPREMDEFDTTNLASILDITIEELRDGIKLAKEHSWYKPSVFLKQMSSVTYAGLQEKLFKFPGFFVQTRILRYYPTKTAAHVLGYVGEANERLINKDSYYKSGDYTGISGLEKTYEKELRGKKGLKVYLVDVHNRIKGSYKDGAYDKAAVSGKSIVTSLDADLQGYGELLMNNKIGSIVAIEPGSGEILCSVSSPGYDPNLLVGRVRGNNYRILSKDTLEPLFNRALTAKYPPGSTFKPLEALIGLQENVLHTYTKYSCSGPSSRPIRCTHNHITPIGLTGSIEQSCNSYYWQVFKSIINNKKYENTEEAFIAWRKYMLDFGFGHKINTDLFNESSGNIPSVAFYDKYYKKGGWSALTIRSLAIGQGEILVTPVQLANYTAIVANRGKYVKPHFIKTIEDEELPDFTRQVVFAGIDSNYYKPVIEGMYEVFEGEHGTARWYKLDSIPMCGKTGTAENPHGDDHSIFIAFAPKDNPKIAISVIVENSGFGSTWAGPIATLMIEKYLTGEIKRKWVEERMIKGNLIHK